MAAPTWKLLKQGAEAKLFSSEFYGKKVIIKERFSKKYRHPSLDEMLTKERTKAEAKYLVRCRKLGIITPTVYYVDMDANAIYMENIDDGITIREHISNLNSQPKMDGSGDSSAELEMLANKIGTAIGKLHANNIIHGDLTTSNMLLRKSQIVLIDFGLSHVEPNAEDKGVDLYVLERAILSTHPESEEFFELILKSYRKENKASAEVLKKLDEVRMRGRKRTMVG